MKDLCWGTYYFSVCHGGQGNGKSLITYQDGRLELPRILKRIIKAWQLTEMSKTMSSSFLKTKEQVMGNRSWLIWSKLRQDSSLPNKMRKEIMPLSKGGRGNRLLVPWKFLNFGQISAKFQENWICMTHSPVVISPCVGYTASSWVFTSSFRDICPLALVKAPSDGMD